jgi:hypothetical protein
MTIFYCLTALGAFRPLWPSLKVRIRLINTKNSVRTSQQTHYVSVTKANWLMPFKEIIALYCKNHIKRRKTPSEQNAGLLTLKRAEHTVTVEL